MLLAAAAGNPVPAPVLGRYIQIGQKNLFLLVCFISLEEWCEFYTEKVCPLYDLRFYQKRLLIQTYPKMLCGAIGFFLFLMPLSGAVSRTRLLLRGAAPCASTAGLF